MLTIGASRPLVLFTSLALAVVGCNGKADTSQDTTQVAQTAEAPSPDAPILFRGSVVSTTPTQLVLKTDSGNVTLAKSQPFHIYTRAPSVLANVKESSFVGVTSVKQADGSERATQINIFPEELRGIGEGSRMMGPSSGGSGSGSGNRMTNGSVSGSRMTNGTATQSRMSNGSVSSTNGSTLVVQYAGGSQTVTVPPNTPVTELKPVSKDLAAGDQVAVMAKKAADGSLTTDKVISMAK
jgi:hypothetical protein